jgi:hypothetical protein
VIGQGPVGVARSAGDDVGFFRQHLVLIGAVEVRLLEINWKFAKFAEEYACNLIGVKCNVL